MKPTTGQIELAFGLLAGVAIAAVDRFAMRGEVSPLVIIAMLLAAALLAGSLWGIRGWIAAIAMWICVPGARSMEYALNWRDALEPNAFRSTVILAACTFAVTAIGFAIGLAIKRTGQRNTSTRSWLGWWVNASAQLNVYRFTREVFAKTRPLFFDDDLDRIAPRNQRRRAQPPADEITGRGP